MTTTQDKWKRINSACYVFLMFLVGSFGGWLYEEAFYWITEGRLTDRGVLCGPWLPIYGFGIVALYALKRFKKYPVVLFLLCAFITGVWEYIVGWVSVYCFGLRLWDYRGKFMNIDGIVCLRSVLSFGVGGLVFHYLVEPLVRRLVTKQKPRMVCAACLTVFCLFLLDCSWSYLFRTPITY